jgi:hypothetical protein
VPFFAEAWSGEEPAATGVVPATVTVTVLVIGVLLGPRIESVYVVVADGFSCLLPLGDTGPISGAIVNPAGFSVLHTNWVVSPGFIEAGRASNVTTRGAG